MKHLVGILVLSGLLLKLPVYGFAQNIALNKTVVTSSAVSSSFAGRFAVDGSTSTRWSSNASDPQWIYVDLGNQYTLTSVNITWASAYGKNYSIAVSNNASTWTTIKSISGNTSLTNNNSVTETGRYVRIYGTQRGTSSGYSIYELQVLGSLTSCGTPTGLSSSNITTTSATVNWASISGATKYNLQWKASSSSSWNTISGITSTSRSLTGLTASTSYQFQVQTVCSSGTSSYSSSSSFTTTSSCGTPTGLSSSSIATTSATLSWGSVSGATKYNLQWKASSSSSWNTISGITSTSRSLTGLTASTSYQFQVQTVCSSGTSSYSSSSSFTTTSSCGTPTGLSSSSITTTSATLSWSSVSSATKYNLQWKASSSSSWNTISGITSTSRSLTGLTAGTSYQFQVQTVCSSGTSSYSSSSSFTTTSSCGTPTGLSSSSITTTSATLSWSSVSSATNYNLQWKASSSSSWNTISGITSTSRSLTGLAAGTAYQFQVQTVCSSGTSSYSGSTSFTTTAGCGSPTGLSSSSITAISATVSWTSVSGATQYNLQWKLSSSTSWITISGITTTSYILAGLTASTTCQFQVQSVCSAGTSSYSSYASFTTTSNSDNSTGGITTASGKIYYFSSSTGDDSRSSTQAQSSSTPWKTLSKLNSYMSSLQPGDLILFKRGDVFYGNISVTKAGSSSAPIAFSAYGTGAKPVITGFTTISSSSWTSKGNGSYEATVSSGLSTLNSVTLDGSFAAMGKYPKGNAGYLTASSGSTSSISSSGLSGIPGFTGGEIVWRPYHWVLWRGTVTSQSSSSVSFSAFASTLGGSVYPAQGSWGFFFQNHPNACTSLGEWAYTASSKKVTMYFGSSVGSHSVNVSTIENVISIASISYLTFDNLAITGANTESFSIVNSSNIKINACNISFSGHDAIYANSACSNITVTNNNISYSNFNGIVGGGSSGWTITGNTINYTGSVAGMGGSGEGQYTGILNVKSSNVSLNTVTNTGYMPITFQGTNNTVQNNYVDTYCFVKDDGGGIYCGGQNFSGSKVNANIVLNGIGAATGTPDTDGRSHGIYIDDGGYNVEVSGNTTAYCQGGGIYCHNSHELNIHDNTSFGNSSTGIKYYNDANTIANITLTGNIFFARTASQFVSYASGGSTAPKSYFATANNNYWCRPINESNSIQTYVSSSLTNYTLSSWKTYTGKETNSHTSPVTVTDVNKLRFEYNTTTTSKTISLGANYIDAKGTTYTSITLAPFTSAVLIATSGSTAQSIATAEVIEQTDLIEKPSFTIYPNPVRDNFVLQLNNSQVGKMNIQVINQAGSIIRSYVFHKDQLVNQVTLPANDLSTGVYFIHVQIGTWSEKQKIVKL